MQRSSGGVWDGFLIRSVQSEATHNLAESPDVRKKPLVTRVNQRGAALFSSDEDDSVKSLYFKSNRAILESSPKALLSR
jgi:hypothetical protein